MGKKVNTIFLFFLLGKLIVPFYSFILFYIILPMMIMVMLPIEKVHKLCFIELV
jgi:hypothetical protein